jgi:hypothetical protein
MREYHRNACERVIRYGTAWALRHSYEWQGDARYPRLPYDGYSDERARYEATICVTRCAVTCRCASTADASDALSTRRMVTGVTCARACRTRLKRAWGARTTTPRTRARPSCVSG